RIVRRQRPHDPRIVVGVGTPSSLSFPSSHATSTAAALVALSRISGSKAPLAGIPVMMASRLVLGVHYPTDVCAGVALGVATEQTVHRFAVRPTVRGTSKENGR
ncbi:phosphatase PAP2 family protein, partial [Corynebacterium variabile]|uniref:phosphatase PAP2 family protein n=1 Tax=Corynebacterium variabile TaxID=1727 RepID=UPI003BB057BA